MQVQALVSFAAIVNDQSVAVRAGDVIELPDGADWVQAGLVSPVAASEVETAENPLVGVERRPQRKAKRNDA